VIKEFLAYPHQQLPLPILIPSTIAVCIFFLTLISLISLPFAMKNAAKGGKWGRRWLNLLSA